MGLQLREMKVFLFLEKLPFKFQPQKPIFHVGLVSSENPGTREHSMDSYSTGKKKKKKKTFQFIPSPKLWADGWQLFCKKCVSDLMR